MNGMLHLELQHNVLIALQLKEYRNKKSTRTNTSVKQQIKWSNVVLLTVIHLMALYAAAVVVPRRRLFTFAWSRGRLVCLLHTYKSI